MKFDHGYWKLLPGTEAIHPISIVDVRVEADALEIVGHSHPIRGRSDFVHGTTITARFTSPMPNVIRVQLTHFKGRKQRKPAFDLNYELTDPDVCVGKDGQHAWLKSGALTVSAPTEGNWGFAFERAGRPLTASEQRAIGLFTQNGKTYLREQLSLQPGETIYGLGEKFGPFVKNGQSFDSWNEDGGTSTDLSYKNVPFYITNRGYGVLVNHPGRVSYEIESHWVGRVQFSVEGHSLDYYVFGGPTMKDALDQYTALSGRPALLPDWSFGLWLSTSFQTSYDEETIISNIERMEALGIPITVFHFDCFWMKELTWTSLIWDERNFPDPARLLRRIREKGIRVCLWINPYIAEASPMFDEGMEHGYLLQTLEGDVYQVDDWQPGIALVDFTNPAAREWFATKLQALVDMGVDAFKTDFAERIPLNVRYCDGSDPERMHNYYTYLYNQTVYEVLEQANGKGQAVLFGRSATSGNQKYPLHWGGDNLSTYPSMAETLRGGLSLGLCGYGFWSHDISGFVGKATPDLYKRWVAFGLLSSHSRLHGESTARMPWIFDDEAGDVLCFFNRLKTRLMPYLLDAAQEAHDHGWPVLRAMVLEYPDDLTCRHLDMQYMLGSALLVAPIFDPSGIVAYYLPDGEWRHLLTGEVVQGGRWRKEQYDYFSLPVWVNVQQGAGWECLNTYQAE